MVGPYRLTTGLERRIALTTTALDAEAEQFAPQVIKAYLSEVEEFAFVFIKLPPSESITPLTEIIS
jgi:hypothetical protein